MNERPPFRGKRGAERRLVERISTEYAERKAKTESTAVDFDVAAVDAEVDDARRLKAAQAASARAGAGAKSAAQPAATAIRPARRVPDLSALPPLLVASGSFGALQERIGSPAAALSQKGRHAGLTTIPHGAKSFLGAALAATGERLLWIARDSEIGDRLAEELGAWLGDPGSVVVLEPRTALAYERSELVPDETAARVAALAAWRSGHARVLVASVQALLQHTLRPADLPGQPRRLVPGDRLVLDRFLLELLGLGYQPVIEVAGRGEFARRGGIVDVFPPGSALPVRIELFGDEVDSLRSFDPTDQRTTERIDSIDLLPATEFLIPAGGIEAIRTGLGRAAARLPERLAADLARFESARSEGTRTDGKPASRLPMAIGLSPRAMPPRSGPASSARPPDWTMSRPRRWSSSTSRATWPRRPSSCGARPTNAGPSSSPPASCPRTGRSPISGRATGRAGSSGREPWSSPGSPRRARPRARRWPPGPVVGRPLRLARARRAGRPDRPVGRAARGMARGGCPDHPRLGPGAPSRRAAGGGRSASRRNESIDGGAAARCDRPDRAQPERRLQRRSRRPGRDHRSRALRLGPRPPSEGAPAGRPAGHPGAAQTGDLVVHIDHGVARYEQMLRRGGAGEERDYLELSFAGGDRIYVPVEQIARVSRYSGGEHPTLSRLGRHRLAAHEAAGQEGRRRPGRGAPRAVRDPRRRGGPRLRARHALAGRDGGELPVRGDGRPAPGDRRDEGRHGVAPADGSTGRGRRGLRQDRGGDPGRVQGDPGRPPGGRPGADDGACCSARHDVLAAFRRIPADGPAAQPVRPGPRRRRPRSPASPAVRSTS